MSCLAIELLGEPRIRMPEGGEDAGRFDRPHLLLYYLAAHAGIPCRRDRLAELFWAEKGPDPARLSLRQCLHKVRNLCGPAAESLVVDRTTVTLMAGPLCRVDVAELEEAVRDTASRAPDPTVLTVWRGPFLEGYPGDRGLTAYDDWVEERRRALTDRGVYLLEQAVAARREAEDDAGALALVRRFRAVLAGRRPRWLVDLEASDPLPVPGAAAREPGEMERRPVTVVHLDPFASVEDPAPDALVPEMERLTGILADHGGHVVAFPGGGLVAYFGYPRAREDAPHQALRAALAAVSGGPPWLRAGVAGGMTLTTSQPARPEAVGEVARAAFDEVRRAAAGEVRVADPVLQGLEGRFVFAADEAGWRVLAETGRSLRLAATARSTVTPLLNREEELARMESAWQAARQGRGGSLALRGEAGMGKTRLLLAFRERVAADEGAMVRELVCDPADRHRPLAPVLDYLRRLLPLYDGEVRGMLENWGVTAGAGVVDDLQGLVDGDGRSLASTAQRAAILDLLARVVAAIADHRPTAWLLDDLQWMDPSTRELLERLVRVARGRPLFLLLAGRSDGYLPAEVDEVVDVPPLSDETARTLLRGVAGPREPAGEEWQLRLAGGNPLYLEEVARQGAVHGDGVPRRLRDLLAAGVDALGENRPLARLAAVAGYAFPRSLLNAAEPGAGAGLERLVATGLLLREGGEGYRFRHALLQEAILDSLPRSEYRALAGRLAAVLRDELPELAGAGPARLAGYHEAAGERLPAARAFRDAALQALDGAARVEAVYYLRRGLALLEGGGGFEEKTELIREMITHLEALGEPWRDREPVD